MLGEMCERKTNIRASRTMQKVDPPQKIKLKWTYGPCEILVQGLIGLIEYPYHKMHLLFWKPIFKEPLVKCAWPIAILGWETD